jgi:CheY-like chemotaxis protein
MEWQVSKIIRPATGKRILVVEDEEIIRTLLAHVLKSAGYAVDTVDTVAAAMAQMDTHPYNLVLADERLPDGRGLTIADQATARGMDAVIVTGYAMGLSREELARHDHVLKPVTPIELVRTVARHIGGGDGDATITPDDKTPY